MEAREQIKHINIALSGILDLPFMGKKHQQFFAASLNRMVYDESK